MEHYFSRLHKLSNIVSFIGTIALLLLVHVSRAQNSSPQELVDAHNAARAQVGVGPLSWDNNVADFAQNYANQRAGDCALVHSPEPRRYGENIAVSSRAFSGTDAVNLWVCEKNYYDHNSNSCLTGNSNSCFNGPIMCGHYTQVVWKDSVRLGCGSVTCSNGGTFVVCSYDPPGNVSGQSPY